MKEKTKVEKFCGNCSNHSPHDYPDKIFCSIRFIQNKNPIVETLWCCNKWNAASEECYCVEEAMKKKNEK